MNFDQKELSIIGHWSSSSKMPERYGRAVCATELLLRNTIVQNFVSGWSLAPSFHLPLTAPNDLRIGKPQTEDAHPSALPSTGAATVVDENDHVPETQLTETQTTQLITTEGVEKPE